jgi:hypothetical protein
MLEWEYSRNQGRHEASIKVNGGYSTVRIVLTNRSRVIHSIAVKEGYDLYHVSDQTPPLLLTHGKTVKELKHYAEHLYA